MGQHLSIYIITSHSQTTKPLRDSAPVPFCYTHHLPTHRVLGSVNIYIVAALYLAPAITTLLSFFPCTHTLSTFVFGHLVP